VAGIATPLQIAPVTLTGRFVRLEPLSRDHLDALARVAFEPSIWTWMPTRVLDRASLEKWVDDALAGQRTGTSLPFATVLAAENLAVGTTRYLNISARDGRLEIGGTWLSPRHQRSVVNTEAKYLMLKHAFETLGATRVEFKTHSMNEQSRRAIERIGGVFEGIHRKHMLHQDGTRRDSAWYSIVDEEWEGVKGRLEGMLF
jgi:N-acetyltransferase